MDIRGLVVNASAAPADRTDDGDEAALARAAAAGDRRAFAALYDRHLDAVYRFAYYRTRSAPDAEDVTADVFSRALAAMPRYEPRRPFLAFLYRIARNVIVDRARATRPQAAFEEALRRPTDEPGPEELSLATDTMRGLRAAIAQLTPLQQDVVVLHFIEGRPTKEIATLTGKPESTIRGIQMRALASLRRILPEAAEMRRP